MFWKVLTYVWLLMAATLAALIGLGIYPLWLGLLFTATCLLGALSTFACVEDWHR
jgi:hypothetical protein